MKRSMLIVAIVALLGNDAIPAAPLSVAAPPRPGTVGRSREIPVVMQLDGEALLTEPGQAAAIPSPRSPQARQPAPAAPAATESPALTAHPDECGCPYCTGNYAHSAAKCPGCEEGWVNDFAPCRHCIQPRDINGPTFCDLTAGDEPCGTCDACLEHRAAPCEHADEGWGPKGEFNPYHQSPAFATPPRWATGFINNGAHRFPIYYNPAPYYRPTWNPSMFGAYQRPFTFRWTCEEVYDNSGTQFPQVVYGYSCKFCGRNADACPGDICNANHAMNPKSVRQALDKMRDDSNKKLIEATGSLLRSESSTDTGQPAARQSGATDTLDDDGLHTLIEPAE